MRMRSVFVLLCLGLLLFPVSLINGSDSNNRNVLTPRNLDSDIGVIAGDIFYYNIDKLVIPPDIEIDNVTLPDFSGNQIFVKVLYVNDNYQYDFSTFGTAINYAVGFKFAKETTFGLDFSLLDTDIIIPEGSTTPSVSTTGNPHFEDTPILSPTIFFLNTDWESHQTALEDLGFTVTNDASELSAIMFVDAGVVTFTWRKIDGALTHLMIEDIIFMDTDFTDTAIEISLTQVASRPLELSPGDQIVINIDKLDIDFDVSGDLASFFNKTEVNEEINSYKSLEGKSLIRLIVQEVYGVYYTCTAWVIDDLDTGELQPISDDLYFIGFQGLASYLIDDLPNFNWEDYSFVGAGYLPAITPDWDIYEGYMQLGNTLLGVYIDSFLDMLQIEYDNRYETINELEVSFGFEKKRDYYYYQQSMTYDIEYNLTYYYNPLSDLGIQAAYTTGYRNILEDDLYIAYHESGIFAGMRVKYSLEEIDYNYGSNTDFTTGSIRLKIDVKLRNPDYNPPDAFGGGFISGFEWLIAIPTISFVSLITIYFQKRKLKK